MNKKELTIEVARRTGITQKEASHILDTALDTIADTLSQGQKVTLTGFGSFEVKSRAARAGRNPITGEKIALPSSKVLAFKSGKPMKDKIR